MSSLTTKRQARIDDNRQIVSAEQLTPGMHIACLAIHESENCIERIAKAAFTLSLLRIAEKPEESPLTTFNRVWNHSNIRGISPLWRGIFLGSYRHGVANVKLTGATGTDMVSSINYLNKDASELPDLEEPIIIGRSYSDMGLEPIGEQSIGFRGSYEPRPYIGRWHRNVTVNLSVSTPEQTFKIRSISSRSSIDHSS